MSIGEQVWDLIDEKKLKEARELAEPYRHDNDELLQDAIGYLDRLDLLARCSGIEMRTRFSWGTASILLVEGSSCLGGLDAQRMLDHWYLTRLVVRPQARGEGWGRKMIEWLQSKADKIIVDPGGYDMEQDKIESFYKHMGFIEKSRRFVWEAKA